MLNHTGQVDCAALVDIHIRLTDDDGYGFWKKKRQKKTEENLGSKVVNVKLFDTATHCYGLLDTLRLKVKCLNM